MRTYRRLIAVVVGLVALPGGLSAQARGVVTGQVVDDATGSPLAAASVVVAGTTLGTISGPDGRFSISNVPLGGHRVRASRLGYSAASHEIVVAAGPAAVASFRLNASAIELDAIVVTGTAGAVSRREQPAVVASVDVGEALRTGVAGSVRDLLTGEVPGVSITASSGVSGASQQIRVRGAASVSLSNEPLVFIDGVRADARTSAPVDIGGQGVSRLFDIDPQDIESIEVVKGPAAATLYGADASAGVIQIITRKGAIGSDRFSQSVSMEYDRIDPHFELPSNFAACPAAFVAEDSPNPLCRGQEPGTVVSDNPLVRDGGLRDGSLRSLGYTARGGADSYGYFMSLGYDAEDGYFATNGLDRKTGRVNFTFVPHPKLSFQAGFGMGATANDMPISDNHGLGYMVNGLMGSPLSRGFANDGFFAPYRDVAAISAIRAEVNTLRYTPVLQATFAQRSWLTHRVIAGADVARERAMLFFPKNDIGMYQGNANRGEVTEGRNSYDIYTLDYLGTARSAFGPGERLSSELSLGTQVISETADRIAGKGIGLTTNGAHEVDAAAERSVTQGYAQQNSIGLILHEQIGFDERLFLQLGGRVDLNSSFGGEADYFFLPKAGVSWVVSEEPFYARLTSLVPTLRLRAAYGETGRSPAVGASLRTYDAAPYAIDGGATGAGVVPFNPGNQELRPERGREFEAGFEAGLFDQRIGVEVTYFNKRSTDLLVRRPVAPSGGYVDPGDLGRNYPYANLGEAVNEGVEFAAHATVVDLPGVQWEVNVGGSTLRNELISLGEVDGTEITPFGSLYRFTPGQPLGSFHGYRITSVDTENGVAVVSDTTEFLGNLLPTLEGNLGTSLRLAGGLEVTGQLDWKRNFSIYNLTRYYRERFLGNEEKVVTGQYSTEEMIRRFGPYVNSQGQPVAPTAVDDPYVEDASFVRLREVAVTYSLPDGLASRLGATGASLTLGGQNLGLWTKYSGLDPEVVSSVSLSDYARDDFFASPQPRRWVARFNLQF